MGLGRVESSFASVLFLRHASPPQTLDNNGDRERPGPYRGLDEAGRNEIRQTARALRFVGFTHFDRLVFGRLRRITDSVRTYLEEGSGLSTGELTFNRGAEDIDRHAPRWWPTSSPKVRKLREESSRIHYANSPDGRVAAEAIKLWKDLQRTMQSGRRRVIGIVGSGTPFAYLMWLFDNPQVFRQLLKHPNLLGKPGFTVPSFSELEKDPRYELPRGTAIEVKLINGQYISRQRVDAPVSTAAARHKEL